MSYSPHSFGIGGDWGRLGGFGLGGSLFPVPYQPIGQNAADFAGKFGKTAGDGDGFGHEYDSSG